MTYKITGYNECDKTLRRKLLAFGLTPRTTFEIVRVAPLGDPIEIKVRGFSLSLRKTEYDILITEQLPGCSTKSCTGCFKHK